MRRTSYAFRGKAYWDEALKYLSVCMCACVERVTELSEL